MPSINYIPVPSAHVLLSQQNHATHTRTFVLYSSIDVVRLFRRYVLNLCPVGYFTTIPFAQVKRTVLVASVDPLHLNTRPDSTKS